MKWLFFSGYDADLAFWKEVIESPSSPLLVPVVHLPETTGHQTQRQTDKNLLHNAWSLQSCMCCLEGPGHFSSTEAILERINKIHKHVRYQERIYNFILIGDNLSIGLCGDGTGTGNNQQNQNPQQCTGIGTKTSIILLDMLGLLIIPVWYLYRYTSYLTMFGPYRAVHQSLIGFRQPNRNCYYQSNSNLV